MAAPSAPLPKPPSHICKHAFRGTKRRADGTKTVLPTSSATDDERDLDVIGWDTLVPRLYRRTHVSRWTIEAPLHADCCVTWVDEFEAWHPIHGYVHGRFSSMVFADSDAAYAHFTHRHPTHELNLSDY